MPKLNYNKESGREIARERERALMRLQIKVGQRPSVAPYRMGHVPRSRHENESKTSKAQRVINTREIFVLRCRCAHIHTHTHTVESTHVWGRWVVCGDCQHFETHFGKAIF